jgi:hypothetical protein
VVVGHRIPRDVARTERQQSRSCAERRTHQRFIATLAAFRCADAALRTTLEKIARAAQWLGD